MATNIKYFYLFNFSFCETLSFGFNKIVFLHLLLVNYDFAAGIPTRCPAQPNVISGNSTADTQNYLFKICFTFYITLSFNFFSLYLLVLKFYLYLRYLDKYQLPLLLLRIQFIFMCQYSITMLLYQQPLVWLGVGLIK